MRSPPYISKGWETLAGELHICLKGAEFQHIRDDINEMKANSKEAHLDIMSVVKDQGKEMLLMRDSHIETKIHIQQIHTSQTTQMAETKENQRVFLAAVQELKEEPQRRAKAKSMVIWTFGVTYAIGSVLSLLKTFAPKLIGQ